MNVDEVLYKLTTLLDRKKERMKMILDITTKQGNLFAIESIDRLNDTLKLKQECIDDINRLDKQFEEYYKRYESFISSIAEECKSNETTASLMKLLQESTEHVQEFIKQIKEVELSNNKKANNLMNEIRSNIHILSNDKKAFTAYTSVNKYGAMFDKRK